MIDDKLREILENTIPGDHAVYFEPYGDAIAQIKEAFARQQAEEDAEFEVCPYCGHHVQRRFRELHATLHSDAKKLMTGQEWLSRFEKEFKAYAGDYSMGWQAEVMDVAERAAGLTE